MSKRLGCGQSDTMRAIDDALAFHAFSSEYIARDLPLHHHGGRADGYDNCAQQASEAD